VRLQPTVQLLRHRTSCASAINLQFSLDSRHIHSGPQSIALRSLYPRNAETIPSQCRRGFASTSKRADSPSPNNSNNNTNLSPPNPDPHPLSDPLNPPASTRPPPLDIPDREEGEAFHSYLFKVGKKYLAFYWAGIKAIFANRQLLLSLPDIPRPNIPKTPTSPSSALSSSSSLDKSANPSRAVLLLRARVRHDIGRLPFFALLVLICGELTPIIVLVFPRLTPYTCRIPSQTAVIRRAVEARRAASFRNLSHVITDTDADADSNANSSDMALSPALEKLADGHICRSLYKGSRFWDKVGIDVPFASTHAANAVASIVGDDALLREGGGVQGLVDDEVVLACEERGIDTLGKDVNSLREQLEAWVAQTAPSQTKDAKAAIKESTQKVRRLLLGLDRQT